MCRNDRRFPYTGFMPIGKWRENINNGHAFKSIYTQVAWRRRRPEGTNEYEFRRSNVVAHRGHETKILVAFVNSPINMQMSRPRPRWATIIDTNRLNCSVHVGPNNAYSAHIFICTYELLMCVEKLGYLCYRSTLPRTVFVRL